MNQEEIHNELESLAKESFEARADEKNREAEDENMELNEDYEHFRLHPELYDKRWAEVLKFRKRFGNLLKKIG